MASARQTFAALGYGNAGLKSIASAAGVTVPALYHYFPSKRALYVRVFDEVERLIFERLEGSVQEVEGFLPRLERILDEIVTMNREDHSVSGFYVTIAIDARRNPDLSGLDEQQAEIARRFYLKLVAEAVDAGELPPDIDSRDLVNLITVTTAGLARLSVGCRDPAEHERAANLLKRLYRGLLSADAQLAATRPQEHRKDGICSPEEISDTVWGLSSAR